MSIMDFFFIVKNFIIVCCCSQVWGQLVVGVVCVEFQMMVRIWEVFKVYFFILVVYIGFQFYFKVVLFVVKVEVVVIVDGRNIYKQFIVEQVVLM